MADGLIYEEAIPVGTLLTPQAGHPVGINYIYAYGQSVFESTHPTHGGGGVAIRTSGNGFRHDIVEKAMTEVDHRRNVDENEYEVWKPEANVDLEESSESKPIETL